MGKCLSCLQYFEICVLGIKKGMSEIWSSMKFKRIESIAQAVILELSIQNPGHNFVQFLIS